MSDRIRVLFDTDIGSDIDDALCLVYLLRQPRAELLGVTTVTGQPQKRAMLVDAICRAEGRTEVPIHSGASQPLLIAQRQPSAPQAQVLERHPHAVEFPPNTAVDFLRAAIRSRPGEVQLVAVGPLTNIAILFALDPELPGMLRGLTLMCGSYTSSMPGAGRTEWNAAGDPHAAAIAFRAAVTDHVSLGLDVTLRCRLDSGECRRRLRGGGLEVVAEMAEVWFRSAEHICFHDPLAAAVVFRPGIVTLRKGEVEVELVSDRARGMTHWQARDDGPHRIGVDVDVDGFFTEYFGVLGVTS